MMRGACIVASAVLGASPAVAQSGDWLDGMWEGEPAGLPEEAPDMPALVAEPVPLSVGPAASAPEVAMPEAETVAPATAEPLSDIGTVDAIQPRLAPPPMTMAEAETFGRQVLQCWNPGSLQDTARRTTVWVEASFSTDGRPMAESIRMTRFVGGPEAAARQTFESARRAILRCGVRGYPLPADKYDRWRTLEMKFEPTWRGSDRPEPNP